MDKELLLKEVQELFSNSQFKNVYDKLLPMWEDGRLKEFVDTKETNMENDLCFFLARSGRFISQFDTSKEVFGYIIEESNKEGNYERTFRTAPFYGDVLRCSGDAKGAEAFLKRAIKEQDKLVNQGKMNKDNLAVGSAYLELSKLEENPDEKRGMLDIAETSLKEFLRTDQNPPLYPRRFLHTIQEQRIPILRSQGKDNEAADLYRELIDNAGKDKRMAHEKYSSMQGLAYLNVERNVDLKEAADCAAQSHDFFEEAGYKGALWFSTYCELKARKGLGQNYEKHAELVAQEGKDWEEYTDKTPETQRQRSNLIVSINNERLNMPTIENQK
ncbi:MAG: hypothetical protein ACM3KR_00425 [Deltaproteobacteria bacterium]